MFFFFPSKTHNSMRWTFNKPAVRAYFERASGIRIAVSNDGVRLKPLLSTSPEPQIVDDNGALEMSVSLEHRTRGGAEANILEDDPLGLGAFLVSALHADSKHPYYMLAQKEDGWISVAAYRVAGDPPKLDPHMRVWDTTLSQDRALEVPQDYPNIVRNAADFLRVASRKAGRRGSDFEAAVRVMDDFEGLVRDVRPDLIMPPVDIAALRTVTEGLLALLAHAEHNSKSKGELR